ncbi:MAG TPA: VenA family class IV lanthipeptide [Pseudonocardiaceae bacterium]|nr:VenA family class IV lanthipeptide [Pseudonocardiaceae bacterium]
MELANFDLVASLQALPETDPIEIEGIQFGGGTTCQCIGLLTLLNSVCVGISCA